MDVGAPPPFARMPDPRCQLIAQELTFAAMALRAEARRSQKQAADQAYVSSRAIFQSAAETYDALAEKLTRNAEQCSKAQQRAP